MSTSPAFGPKRVPYRFAHSTHPSWLDRKMNSLNILSARVSPPPSPGPSRSNSYGNILSSTTLAESRRNSREDIFSEKTEDAGETLESEYQEDSSAREETPLLSKERSEISLSPEPHWLLIPRRISVALLDSIRWFFSTLAAPGVYLIACLYDERGNFAPFWSRQASSGQAIGMSGDHLVPLEQDIVKSTLGRRTFPKSTKRSPSVSTSSGLSSESESDRPVSENDQPVSSSSSRHTRSKSLQSPDEIAPQRRSIRIKLHNEDSLRQRKHKKSQSTSTQSNGSGAIGEISPATLKSPTSPASSLLMTKYPRAPAPPRPLIPRRQPSYTLPEVPTGRLAQKTLILDLDETLIHSMAKGGRMSTGHMVEVKLNTIAGSGAPGPQHPILYYVHKRPHCDDFLRRVSGSMIPISNSC